MNRNEQVEAIARAMNSCLNWRAKLLRDAAKAALDGPAAAMIAEAERRGAVKALREAADEFAEGAWAEAWAAAGVEDDVSAVQATDAWFRGRADAIESGGYA